MTANWGHNLNLTIFGESHGAAVGVVLDGLGAGLALDEQVIACDLARRSARGQTYATARQEADVPEILSGVYRGKTTGTPLCAIFRNADARSADYAAELGCARPGHADYTGFVRYGGFNDPRGGGHFSGRLTAPLVFAGALARLWLAQRGVMVGAHILQIGAVRDDDFDAVAVNAAQLTALRAAEFPTLQPAAAEQMQAAIAAAQQQGDSLGGIVECAAVGLPVGWGEPFFGGLESVLASLLYAIPAVKGVEFGAGFGVATLRGSENNDEMLMESGEVRCRSNQAGGAYGGITSGMPLLCRVACKPTPSIGLTQQTVDLRTLTDSPISCAGRHDACIVPRALAAVEAACALGLCELALAAEMRK